MKKLLVAMIMLAFTLPAVAIVNAAGKSTDGSAQTRPTKPTKPTTRPKAKPTTHVENSSDKSNDGNHSSNDGSHDINGEGH